MPQGEKCVRGGTGEKIRGDGKGKDLGEQMPQRRKGERISTGKGGKDLSKEKGEDLRGFPRMNRSEGK